MPIVRIDNYVEAYRIRAQAEDIHEMAARPNKKPLTEFVNRRILEAIEPGPDDYLVDIGCGEASLLRMARTRVAQCVGVTGSTEEKLRLEAEYPELSIAAGKAQALPIQSGSASKIVCNAVLMYLQREDEVMAALGEMARIARRGAVIWLGEVPEIDEYAHYGMYRGSSMSGLLWHILKHNGLRAFLGMIRRWLSAVLGREQIVLNSAGIFYAGPDRMVALAESRGLHLRSYFRHKELDREGNIVESEFRYDYVFTV